MNIVLGKRLDRYLGGLLVYLASPLVSLLRKAKRKANREPQDPKTIVLMKFWGLGNIILISPLVQEFRRRYPEARLVFLSFSTNRDVISRMEEVDETICLNLSGWFRFALSFVGSWWRIRGLRASLLVDFEQFCYLSSLIACTSLARRTIGFDTEGSSRGRLYSQAVPYLEDGHMITIFSRLLEVASGEASKPVTLRPVRYSEAEGRAALELVSIGKGGPIVGLHPGSGDNFPGRRWSAERFAELSDHLIASYGCRVYFTGSDGESPLVERILAHMKNTGLNLCGKTSLGVLSAVLDRSALFISNDTGPLHLAAAMRCKVVAIYGPNTPLLYGPYTDEALVFYRDLPCSPCISNLNLKESSCRLPLCVQSIQVDEIFAAIQSLGWLNESRSLTPQEVVEC